MPKNKKEVISEDLRGWIVRYFNRYFNYLGYASPLDADSHLWREAYVEMLPYVTDEEAKKDPNFVIEVEDLVQAEIGIDLRGARLAWENLNEKRGCNSGLDQARPFGNKSNSAKEEGIIMDKKEDLLREAECQLVAALVKKAKVFAYPELDRGPSWKLEEANGKRKLVRTNPTPANLVGVVERAGRKYTVGNDVYLKVAEDEAVPVKIISYGKDREYIIQTLAGSKKKVTEDSLFKGE